MAEVEKVLRGWIIEHLKAKDVLTKQITMVKEHAEDADVVIEGMLKNQYVLIQPSLQDLSRLPCLKEKHVIIVTANAKENMEFLLNKWEEFVQYPHLAIYFANPNSPLDKRWVIFPATHDKITERKALRKGIESLFQTVEEWKE